jgi:uncharacterized protein YdhG (YjbR/CyaY superfamily)
MRSAGPWPLCGSGRFAQPLGPEMDTMVQEYFDGIRAPRKAKIDKLHSLIVDCFPNAEIDMQYRMPTYRYGDGWVAIANQKHCVSLYTCSAEHLVKFKELHPNIKTGKGCINFRDRDAIPEDAVKEVIKHAIGQPKGYRP